jgi:hypothetical protein
MCRMNDRPMRLPLKGLVLVLCLVGFAAHALAPNIDLCLWEAAAGHAAEFHPCDHQDDLMSRLVTVPPPAPPGMQRPLSEDPQCKRLPAPVPQLPPPKTSTTA